jgi:hypothetical protein
MRDTRQKKNKKTRRLIELKEKKIELTIVFEMPNVIALTFGATSK